MKRLTVADLISTGVYTAIYFVFVAIAAIICVFLLPGYSYIFIPVVSALISGTVFMLLAAKIQTFGPLTIMASIMGIFFFVSGRFPLALLPSIMFGLIADAINIPFNYKNKNILLVSYVIFSFAQTGPIIPLFLDMQQYAENLVEDGRDASYITQVFESLPINSTGLLVILIVIAAIIGGLFGQRMVRKHFKRAGIV